MTTTTDPRLTARLLPGSRLAALRLLLATTEKTQTPAPAPAGKLSAQPKGGR